MFKTDSFSPKSTIAAARAAGRKTKARIRARELEEKQMNDNKWLPRMTRREGVSVEGQDSFPGQGLSEARALRGLGISTQNLAEKHSVLQKKRLPFRNMPPGRPAISPRGYAAGTAQINFPWEYWKPQVTLTESECGPWVAVRRKQLRLQEGQTWQISNRQLWEECCNWIDVNSRDIRRAEDWANGSGQSKTQPKPQVKPFIIPQQMAAEHTKHGLYDLRLWGTEKTVSLFELNEVNATSFNSEVLEADCTNSKMPDKLTEQGIARTGLWSPFTGT